MGSYQAAEFAKTSVLLVSETNLQTGALSNLISQQLSIHCKQYSDNVSELKDQRHNIILLDCEHLDFDQAQKVLGELEISNKLCRVALLNTLPDSQHEELAQWPQVKGIFYRSSDQVCLLNGLREIINDGHWLPRKIMHQLLEDNRRSPTKRIDSHKLTKREKQILLYVVDGMTNFEIGSEIHVSEHTVKSHLYNVFKKIGVKNRLQACNWSKAYLS